MIDKVNYDKMKKCRPCQCNEYSAQITQYPIIVTLLAKR